MFDDVKNKKLLYHLTSIKNLPGILVEGLKARAHLSGFDDVADPEIIDGRKALGLESLVPFHWFAGNPFDGRVQVDRRGETFLLISVRRSLAEQRNWKVIPFHPLASHDIRLLDYRVGFESIDWSVMSERDYHEPNSKSVCMPNASLIKPSRRKISSRFSFRAISLPIRSFS